jgi:mannosyltransferase OCH1-like enzyme
MIPKLIHQIWVGPHPIPDKFTQFMENIKTLHPEYEYRLWTDKDLTTSNFTLYEYIEKTPIYAQKADIMRYEILYKYGGIYLDVDFEIFKNLTPILTNSLIICNEDFNVNEYIANCFFACTPNNPNLKRCMENIKHCKLGQKMVTLDTGPHYFRKCIKLDETVKLLPIHVMYPINFHQRGYRPSKFHPETYGMHHWYKSW